MASRKAYVGSPACGAVAGWIALAFSNETSAQTMLLEYGHGGRFGSGST